MTSRSDLTRALISTYSDCIDQPPSHDELEQTAAQLARIMKFDGDLQDIVSDVRISIDTRMDPGVSIVDQTSFHDERWVDEIETPWTYTQAYSKYLREQGWNPEVVSTLEDGTKRILRHLQNPCDTSAWSRRGLVIGHVQSGKTANYTGVIARAADAGYRFIVVIAGIHNNLRQQTQERLEHGFVGRSTHALSSQKPVGVGLLEENYPVPVTLTTIADDFSHRIARQINFKIVDFEKKPIILVIKKNVRVLEALYNWLSQLNADRYNRVSDSPMLIIDDEADHASINTNKEDIDPTKTNRTIRKILSLFTRSCYVGYTATPFANIFIDPESHDDEVHEDLFPRDFIHCLDPPSTYFGAHKIFLLDEHEPSPLRVIDDCEELIPLKHKKDHVVQQLPESMYRAIAEFILARAIRNLRGQRHKHCSMMINVSRFVAVQRRVGELVRHHLAQLGAVILSTYCLPEKQCLRHPYMCELHEVFEAEYADLGFSWTAIQATLHEVMTDLEVRIINGKSEDVLDYTGVYEKGLTVIAVGGLSLSRGLTLEGLTISYMYRSTRMYDTLMQMGRWFGYRPGFQDLCRIHLSAQSSDWYAHIARSADELMQQIREMRRNRMSPRDFGLYVRRHPDSLMITAYNKMRAGESMTQEQSYSSQLVEISTPCYEEAVNTHNFGLIREMCEQGFGGNEPEFLEKGIFFRDVDTSHLAEFIRRFELASMEKDLATGQMLKRSYVVQYLEKIQEHYPHSDVILISPNHQDGSLELNAQSRKCESGNLRDDTTFWYIERQRVASRGDEKLGLDQAVIDDIKSRYDEMGKSVPDLAYRAERQKPLLMIHRLRQNDEGKGPFSNDVATFGISFPFNEKLDETIEVMVNRTYLAQQLQLDMNQFDEAADDDDED